MAGPVLDNSRVAALLAEADVLLRETAAATAPFVSCPAVGSDEEFYAQQGAPRSLLEAAPALAAARGVLPWERPAAAPASLAALELGCPQRGATGGHRQSDL